MCGGLERSRTIFLREEMKRAACDALIRFSMTEKPVSFDLENGSYLDLKDPEVACDMNGQSGTSSKTVSKVIDEVLPSERKHSFSEIEMGAIPEQVAYFNCYVTSALVKW